MKSRWLVCVFAAITLLAFGCSGSDDGINNDPGPDDIRGDGGSGGTPGSVGSAGDGGSGGTGGDGSGGSGGAGGVTGTGGATGMGGTGGSVGTGGSGGSNGTGGSGGTGGTGGSGVARVFFLVSSGEKHSCGVTTEGIGFCWGARFGTSLNVPRQVSVNRRFVSISAGTSQTCVVSASDDSYVARCWGAGSVVGDGTSYGSWKPLQTARLFGIEEFMEVTTGATTCALTVDGLAYCWGWDTLGGIGNGKEPPVVNHSSPEPVASNERYVTLDSSWHTTCAVRTTGETDCWGPNTTGQIGDGTLVDRESPTMVQTSLSFVTVTTGARPDPVSIRDEGGTSCGVTGSGDGYCWGWNESGQVGDDTRTMRLLPVQVVGGHSWRRIDVGSNTTCGVTTLGVGYCWGFNGNGVVGDGTYEDRQVPTEVAGEHEFDHIEVGFDHACGVTTGGDIYCWGYNTDGQLGDGSTAGSPIPVQISMPN